MNRVEKLPKRDGVAALKRELDECRALSQNETSKRQCGEIAIIVDKIAKESQYWSKHITQASFNAGINVTERSDALKAWFSRSLSRREDRANEAIKMITNFDWLNQIQTPDVKKDELIKFFGREHSLI
jgi:hypothetical protein